MISYGQQCHNGTDVNYLCAIIISINIMLSSAFSSVAFWITLISFQPYLPYVIKNKHNDHMSNVKSNVKVFLPKNLPSFFQIQEKLKTCLSPNLRGFRRSSLGDYIHVKFRPLSLYNFTYITNFIHYKKSFWPARIWYMP